MKAISLFSGCGGDTLGMINSGIDVVAFSENNKNCIETHEQNFKNCKLISALINNKITTDITLIPDEIFEEYKNNIDLIFSGFPCQAFSHAGKKLALEDPRGTLYKHTIRVIKIINPKYFILENVVGLLRREYCSKNIYNDIIKPDFEKTGYTLFEKIIDCSKYGIPQLRKRVFIVGVRKDLNKVFEFPKEINQKTSIRNILENTLENSTKFEKDIEIKHAFINENSEKPTGKVHPYILTNINLDRISFGKRDKSVYGQILDPDEESKTIICSYAFQPRMYTTIKNKNGVYIRTLNVNELKQIQSFPKDFQICGNETNQIKQIGNAVPPKIVEILCKNLSSN